MWQGHEHTVMAALAPQHITPLFTDLYEVTMAQACVAEQMSGMAVFENLVS
jgi:nicotinate phosphoribosyltransferase